MYDNIMTFSVEEPDLEQMVFYDPKGKYTKEEKINYLRQAILDGGYYGENHVWNSILVFSGDKRVYRGRVETLVIKDDKYIFLRFIPKSKDKKETYTVPGGSFDINIPNMTQAENECKEEARILLSNIQSSGITYKEYSKPKEKYILNQAVNWCGNYTEIYIGKYAGKYTGHIDKEDEDKFMITGKFYDLDKIFRHLKEGHQMALSLYYPGRFNTSNTLHKKEEVVKESKLSSKARKKISDESFGIPSLRKFPLNDKAHVLAAIRMFNRVDKKYERELAENLLKAMKKYKIPKTIIGKNNRLISYI